MKKLCKFILSFFLAASLGACSQADNVQDASVTFFDALHKTLSVDSVKIEGKVEADLGLTTSVDYELWLDQKESLQLAITSQLDVMGVGAGDFIDFYIKDGKTYLDTQGTKSSSTVEKIGLKKDGRLEVWDPFLSLTDKEKAEIFKSAKVNGDEYTFELDPNKLSTYLDEMGGADISEAKLKATINDGYITSLNLDVSGTQNIEDKSQDFKIGLEAKASDFNKSMDIPFPDDLDSWPGADGSY